ncbi:sulfatase-like hydrolase/transferase [uncultured Gimesia sp.]|uniref:sulfatase-like hydrolase/transferase n=1 Tax=uncultured Gimesia sp. TaxID=1678688 RepID=UPI0030DBB96B|tara:strand:+ start:178715 stop:180514 length:1800 start_codon:yes stop_codon:yes gene_type:complete
MNARSKILTVIVLFACSLICDRGQSLQAKEKSRQPNIILVMTDDQGYWDTGISGNTLIETPTLDRMAAEGVTFTRFYANMVCAPTRAGLMTGRHYLRTGLYNTRFGGDTLGQQETTIAQVLQSAGYKTGLFGKWHLGRYAQYQPHRRGFDHFFGHYHGHIERYTNPDQVVVNGTPVETRGYVTDLFTDAAIDFMTRYKAQPFFCYVAYNAPHSPFLLDTSHFGQPEGDKLIEKYLAKGLPLREARIYAMVERIDQNLNRLLQSVKKLGLDQETVVIFTSDNGGVSRAYKAGLKGSKASAYEGGTRVPFVVRLPGHFPAGKSTDAMVAQTDLFPTFCQLAGVKVPEGIKLDGKSILPLMEQGVGKSPHEYLYHTWDRYTPNPWHRWSIHGERFKLVGHDPQGRKKQQEPAGQLYDLQADPGETKDVSRKYPEVASRLRNEFLRWFDDVTEGQVYAPAAIPIGDPQEPDVELQPSWAILKGDGLEYSFDGYDWDTIDGWKSNTGTATWQLDVLQPGRYTVELSYGYRDASPAAGPLEVSVSDTKLTCDLPMSPSQNVFVKQSAGTLDLKAGQQTLTIQAANAGGIKGLRLNSIWLKALPTK